MTHRMRTNGAPCEHGPEIPPGGQWDCVATRPYDSFDSHEGPLWNHEVGQGAPVWIVVKPAPEI